MNRKVCVIVGAGDFDGLKFKYNLDNTLFIAADGGYGYLELEDIIPDVWVGDADSINSEARISDKCRRIDLPVHKDDTDSLAAVKYGIAEGYDEFHIYGSLGGRLDHSISNIRMMSYLTSIGKVVYLFGPGQGICAVENGSLSFSKKESGIVSVFSLTDVSEGVSIKGLEYELENASLNSIDSIGVSNAFNNKPSTISVVSGRLMVMLSRLCELPRRA